MLWCRSCHIHWGNAGRLTLASRRWEAVPNGLQILHPCLHQLHISDLPEISVRHGLNVHLWPSTAQKPCRALLTTCCNCLGMATLGTSPSLPADLCLLKDTSVPAHSPNWSSTIAVYKHLQPVLKTLSERKTASRAVQTDAGVTTRPGNPTFADCNTDAPMPSLQRHRAKHTCSHVC